MSVHWLLVDNGDLVLNWAVHVDVSVSVSWVVVSETGDSSEVIWGASEVIVVMGASERVVLQIEVAKVVGWMVVVTVVAVVWSPWIIITTEASMMWVVLWTWWGWHWGWSWGGGWGWGRATYLF